MKENYISSLERFKYAIDTDESFAQKRSEVYEKCLSVARSINVIELECIYYLRQIDTDGDALSLFKQIYKLKNELKENVLTAFGLWQLVEPFDFEQCEKEAHEQFLQEQKENTIK